MSRHWLTDGGQLFELIRRPKTCESDSCGAPFEHGQAFVEDYDTQRVTHTGNASHPTLSDVNTVDMFCHSCWLPADEYMLRTLTGLSQYHNQALPGTPGIIPCSRTSCSPPVSLATGNLPNEPIGLSSPGRSVISVVS